MTISELAMNWIINDTTGEFCNRQITLNEATAFIENMDPDVLEDLTEDITPEAFMEAWNDIVKEE